MNRAKITSRGAAGPACGALLGVVFLALPLACADRSAVSPLRAATLAVEPPGRLLPAASGDPSAEINAFLPWPPAEESRQDQAAPAPLSATGFVLGLAVPERADWSASARAGVFHERHLRGGAWLAFGLDGGEEEDKATSLSLLVIRAHVGLTGRAAGAQAGRFRPQYRLALAYEWAGIIDMDMGFGRYALLGSLGFEAGPPSEMWNARLEYVLLVGRSAVEGEVFAGLSLRF